MVRKEVPIEYILEKHERSATLGKRKAGLLKKSYEFVTLCGGKLT